MSGREPGIALLGPALEIRVASAITLVKAVTELYLGSRDGNADIPAGRPGSGSIMLYDHVAGILVCERSICPGRQHVYEGQPNADRTPEGRAFTAEGTSKSWRYLSGVFKNQQEGQWGGEE